MGVVGIWCMHFIGNRAIVLDKNQPEIQLVYDPGYTVLSLVLSLFGLTLAFSVPEYATKIPWRHWTALIGTGVVAGLSIVGMHYVANRGISNYSPGYSPRYFAASFIIAIGDCLTVLVLFYSLREKWISSWWKRILCAMSLAGGVSAMHFTAATNCTYTLRHFNSEADIKARDSQVIIAGVMCGTAASGALGFLIYTQWRNRMFKSRSQQITLACVIFNPAGGVLVTTEGVLPSRKITQKYSHRTFDDEFDDTHPVFQWIFRVTHNWQGVGDLIPKMKSHLSAQKGSSLLMMESRPSSSQSSATYDEETYSNYATLFEERFCTAAASMASSMKWPIEQLGVLYDKIIETGTLQMEDKSSKRNTLTDHRYSASADNEAMKTSLFGKGQVMFVTRQVDEADAQGLLNARFKFASVQHVGRNICHAMQIPLPTLEGHMSSVKRYVENLQSVEKKGTYLVFFALIPKPHHKGFDVAVKKDKMDQLPDVKLLDGAPEPWQVDILNRLDGQRVSWILATLEDRSGRSAIPTNSSQEQRFVSGLWDSIRTLIQPFPQEWTKEARFWSQQLVAHYEKHAPTILFAFTVIGDMHASIDASGVLTRTPKTFFEARHRCYDGSPDHAILAHEIHQTFAPIFAKRQPKNTSSRLGKLSVNLTTNALKGAINKIGRSDNSRGSALEQPDECASTHELVDKPPHASSCSSGSERSRNDKQYGGILVNSEMTIQSDNRNDYMPIGMNVAVSTAKLEETFANKLFAITKERFMPANRSAF